MSLLLASGKFKEDSKKVTEKSLNQFTEKKIGKETSNVDIENYAPGGITRTVYKHATKYNVFYVLETKIDSSLSNSCSWDDISYYYVIYIAKDC